MPELKKRVVVLGAGASASYSDSPTRLRPPLAREIIPTFQQLVISGDRLVLIGHIINYVRDTRGIDPINFNSWDEDLEAFMTEIDEKVQQLSFSLRNNKGKGNERLAQDDFQSLILTDGAYNQLVFLFSSILNEIQNGPVSIPYALLAHELGKSDTVITFNWDTLFDRALLTTGKWNPYLGYGVTPDYVFDDKWQTTGVEFASDYIVRYLKLHGSTNWLVPYHGIHLNSGEVFSQCSYGMNKLCVFFKATKPYPTYKERYWGPYEPFSYCYYPPNLPFKRDDSCEGFVKASFMIAPDLPGHAEPVIEDPNVYSMPLLIPPIRDKKYMRYGEVFNSLWSQAEIEISLCSELFIIGYSFPDTDHVSRNLFKNAVQKNRVLEKVVIIDPYPRRAYEVFCDEIGVRSEIIHVRSERFGAKLSGEPTLK
ncbi:MAG: hypothetical protein AAGU75_10610 [Bacillota bacterium]